MPGVSKIDECMRRWSQAWTPDTPVDFECDVFNDVWDVCERYFGTNHYGIRPSYERVLGELTTTASFLSPRPFGNPVIEGFYRIAPHTLFERLGRLSDENVGRRLVLSQLTFLLERLAKHMRTQSRALDSRSIAFRNYMSFFDSLRDRFEIGVYNLNYDNVTVTAWPDAFRGFDSQGNFDPLCVMQRQEWGFVYHLHGSVHNHIESVSRKVVWQDDLGSDFNDCRDPSPDMAQDFRYVPLTTLITGGYKLDRLLSDPYQTFYSTLVRHAQEAQGVLIAGYGFGDLHVNRALRNRFERHDDETCVPKVVIVDKSRRDKRQMASLQSHQFWSYQLTHTLDTRFQISQDHLNRDGTVAPFVERQEFETDFPGRVAIWHGGFVEAFSAVDRIIDHLSRHS